MKAGVLLALLVFFDPTLAKCHEFQEWREKGEVRDGQLRSSAIPGGEEACWCFRVNPRVKFPEYR